MLFVNIGFSDNDDVFIMFQSTYWTMFYSIHIGEIHILNCHKYLNANITALQNIFRFKIARVVHIIEVSRSLKKEKSNEHKESIY